MIQRQPYIYLMLLMSITLNLFQLPIHEAKVASVVQAKALPAPVQEAIAAPVAPSPIAAPPIPISRVTDKYEIDVVMDYDHHFVTVEENVTYINQTDVQLSSLTLAVVPNLLPDCFDLIRLSVNNSSVTNYDLGGQRLNIPLTTPLEPDSMVQLTLRYTLSLPYLSQSNSINAPVFGHTDAQTNLINWYPFIVPYMDGEWVLHNPGAYGDYLVYPIADYSVNLLFVGEETNLVVASSGSAEGIEAFTRYRMEDARAFAFSISPKFEVSSMRVGGTTISSYYLPGYRKAAEAAMKTSAQAVELFSELFGEYPRASLSLVQGDLNDSREFSGLSFISRNFYQLYDGTSKNYLTYASIHTTAHQWWFDQVGNDQAMEPWLDESLAIYSESLYFENMDPRLQSYWQKNRVDFFRPHGSIETSAYDANYDDQQAAYLNGVYFLHDLRERIGEYAFDKFIRDYYQQGRGNIVTREDFFRILDAHTGADLSDLMDQYFDTP